MHAGLIGGDAAPTVGESGLENSGFQTPCASLYLPSGTGGSKWGCAASGEGTVLPAATTADDGAKSSGWFDRRSAAFTAQEEYAGMPVNRIAVRFHSVIQQAGRHADKL